MLGGVFGEWCLVVGKLWTASHGIVRQWWWETKATCHQAPKHHSPYTLQLTSVAAAAQATSCSSAAGAAAPWRLLPPWADFVFSRSPRSSAKPMRAKQRRSAETTGKYRSCGRKATGSGVFGGQRRYV